MIVLLKEVFENGTQTIMVFLYMHHKVSQQSEYSMHTFFFKVFGSVLKHYVYNCVNELSNKRDCKLLVCV